MLNLKQGTVEYRVMGYGRQESTMAPRFLTPLAYIPWINPSSWIGLVNMMGDFKRASRVA